jgi:hypothetical protein
VVTSYARYGGSTYYFVFQEFEESEILLMMMSAPSPIQAESRFTVSNFLTRINWRFKLGFFALDFNDGELCFRLSYDLEGTPLSEKIVMNMIHCGLQTIERHFPAIMGICFGGKNDLEALQEFDEKPLGVELQIAVDVSPADSAHEAAE